MCFGKLARMVNKELTQPNHNQRNATMHNNSERINKFWETTFSHSSVHIQHIRLWMWITLYFFKYFVKMFQLNTKLEKNQKLRDKILINEPVGWMLTNWNTEQRANQRLGCFLAKASILDTLAGWMHERKKWCWQTQIDGLQAGKMLHQFLSLVPPTRVTTIMTSPPPWTNSAYTTIVCSQAASRRCTSPAWVKGRLGLLICHIREPDTETEHIQQ